jgi:hypothetical protein
MNLITKNGKVNFVVMYKVSKIRGGYILYSEKNICGSELGPQDMFLWVSRNGNVVYGDSRKRSRIRKVYWVYNVDLPHHTVANYEHHYDKKNKSIFGR